jgi:hypothetical protein
VSRLRAGTCGEPGPGDLHCTEPPLHRYSCYDAGDDSSWNDRSPEGWQQETPHHCTDEGCESTTVGVPGEAGKE